MAELKQPIDVRPPEVVENVFAMPEVPGELADAQPVVQDWTSVVDMQEFLESRLLPDPQGRRGSSYRIASGVRSFPYPSFDGLRYWLGGGDKKRHLAVFAGVMLAANLLNGNGAHAVADGIETAQSVKDKVEDHFGIGEVVDDCAVRRRVPTTTTHTFNETVRFNSAGETQPVGQAVTDQQIVDKVLGRIQARTRKEGVVLTKEKFVGTASDDWRADPDSHGIGHANPENDTIAQRRLDSTKPVLVARAQAEGIDLSDATFEAHELILNEDQQLQLENAILQNGFDGFPTTDAAIDAALDAYNRDPASLDESLRHTMTELLPRGFSAELTFSVTEQVPGGSRIVCKPAKVPDGKPENHKRDYDLELWPLLLLPYPAFRKKYLERTTYTDIEDPGFEPDPEYLKLYPEARTDQDTLVHDAWAYARKYQHMMRETDRIKALYKLDYVDGEGQPQTLRAMFIDHEPTPDMFLRTAGLLQTISQLQEGRVGHELDMIAVYPSDNAGTKHGNPKKIGLGQDIQFEKNILGVAYPALRLVETHMPVDTTADDLGKHNSPDWVLAHEIAGHFTGLNDKENLLIDTGSVLPNGAKVYRSNSRWDDFMEPNYRAARAEEKSDKPSQWTVHRKIVDLEGNTIDLIDSVPQEVRAASRHRVINALLGRAGILRSRRRPEDMVETGDSRLREALFVSKETGHPTKYGGTNAAEHQAEASASEIVGEIPFSESHDFDGIRPMSGFAQGYHVASRDRESLAQRWGNDLDKEGVVFTDANGEPVKRPDWQHWYGAPQDDEVLAAAMNKARTTPMPYEQDLLHIITGRRISD